MQNTELVLYDDLLFDASAPVENTKQRKNEEKERASATSYQQQKKGVVGGGVLCFFLQFCWR